MKRPPPLRTQYPIPSPEPDNPINARRRSTCYLDQIGDSAFFDLVLANKAPLPVEDFYLDYKGEIKRKIRPPTPPSPISPRSFIARRYPNRIPPRPKHWSRRLKDFLRVYMPIIVPVLTIFLALYVFRDLSKIRGLPLSNEPEIVTSQTSQQVSLRALSLKLIDSERKAGDEIIKCEEFAAAKNFAAPQYEDLRREIHDTNRALVHLDEDLIPVLYADMNDTIFGAMKAIGAMQDGDGVRRNDRQEVRLFKAENEKAEVWMYKLRRLWKQIQAILTLSDKIIDRLEKTAQDEILIKDLMKFLFWYYKDTVPQNVNHAQPPQQHGILPYNLAKNIRRKAVTIKIDKVYLKNVDSELDRLLIDPSTMDFYDVAKWRRKTVTRNVLESLQLISNIASDLKNRPRFIVERRDQKATEEKLWTSWAEIPVENVEENITSNRNISYYQDPIQFIDDFDFSAFWEDIKKLFMAVFVALFHSGG